MVRPAATALQRPACCMAAAREDAEATYCIECGDPLLRCMAFEECGGIVDESGLCPVCVRPGLQIVPGATMDAPLHGSVAVPFELVNASPVNRPLFVRRLWSREGGDWREEQLGWEKLPPGGRGAASVTATALDKPGDKEIEIMWEVTTQRLTREEHFAFSTRVLLRIPDRGNEASRAIRISSENQMNGNIIQIHEADRNATGGQRLAERLDMKVQRLDRLERELGMRGIDAATAMPRSARFIFIGFGAGQVVATDRPIVTADAMLHFGRAWLRGAGGENDVRLLVQGRDGAIDEEASAMISRRHFDIWIENERPMLRVASNNGLRINGQAHGVDRLVALADGDEIAPLVKAPAALGLTLRFRRERNRIAAVEIIRRPAWRERAA